MTRRPTGRERGQATVEVALLAPVAVAVVVLVGQLALVARDRVLVVHAAREAARAAVVDTEPGAAARAAARTKGLDPARLAVTTRREGGLVTAIVSYRAVLNVPFLGRKSPEIRLEEQVTGHAEN